MFKTPLNVFLCSLSSLRKHAVKEKLNWYCSTLTVKVLAISHLVSNKFYKQKMMAPSNVRL